MANLSHDFITVDLRGLKAVLVERARSERVTVSAVVRRAVARELEGEMRSVPSASAFTDERSTKVSILLTAAQAQRLRACGRADGVSMGALLAGLAAQSHAFANSQSRTSLLSALVQSSAELSTLNRSIHHLTVLLRQGSVEAAREYSATLDALAGDVRSHLQLASATLAELRPWRSVPDAGPVR